MRLEPEDALASEAAPGAQPLEPAPADQRRGDGTRGGVSHDRERPA